MAGNAIDVLREEVEWAQDEVIDTAIHHLTENFDSFPVLGLGLSFMKRSAEKMIVRRLEEEVVPDIKEYLDLQIKYIAALADAEDADAVREQYEDELLANDPFLDMLDAPDAKTQELRNVIRERNWNIAKRTADWVQEAGDETFEDYTDFVLSIGKTPEDVTEEIDDLLHYINLMEAHQEHLDASGYSSVLEHGKVHDWFIEHLIDGLEKGHQDVIESVKTDMKEKQE